MRTLFSVTATLCLLTFASVAAADENAMSSHEKAARHLIQVAGGMKNVDAGAEAMLTVVRGNPELAPYEDVFRAWYRKIFAAGDLEGDLAAIYMKYFTEEEMNELAAFYETPVGRKTLASLPEIVKEGAQLGMKRAKDHEDELREMLLKAKEERQKAEADH